jgi:hypothetical protein
MLISSKLKIISVLQIIAAIAMFPVFFAWAPWLAAIPASEAISLYGEKIPTTWKAVVMDHGQIHQWKLGTIEQNKISFTVCSLMLAAILAFIFWSIWYVQRLTRSSGTQ